MTADTRVSGDVEALLNDALQAQKRWQSVADAGGATANGIAVTENEAQIALGVFDWFLPRLARLSTATSVPATAEGVREILVDLIKNEAFWGGAPTNEAAANKIADVFFSTTPSPAQIEAGAFERAARLAHDTLIELNPNNYTHDDVIEANDAAVEAILLLADALGETHGKSPEWWEARRAAIRAEARVPASGGADANGWQTIENAPAHTGKETDNLRVLVIGGVHKEAAIVLADGDWWRTRTKEGSTGCPTHWQHLPALAASPPAAMDGGKGA